MNILDELKSAVIPNWAPWAAGALLLSATAAAFYGLGRVHEARIGAAALASYKVNAAIQTVKVIKGETEVVTRIETVYSDRIVKVTEQGAKIEHQIPDYIPPAADQRFAVNLGFVRIIDGAWDGAVVGPAGSAEAEPSGIPISEIAAVEAGNATSCRVWREQALGWRDFYADQQKVINGKAGDWYHPEAQPKQENP